MVCGSVQIWEVQDNERLLMKKWQNVGLLLFTVSEHTSLGGTYSGIEQMGLLWSLRQVPGSKPGLRWVTKEVQQH